MTTAPVRSEKPTLPLDAVGKAPLDQLSMVEVSAIVRRLVARHVDASTLDAAKFSSFI